MKRTTLTVTALATAMLGLAVQARDIHAPGESAVESEARVDIIRHQARLGRSIRDDAFVYDLARDDFDLAAWLDDHAPHLKPHREAIEHWSGYAGIHPRVVLALMDARSGVVSHPDGPALERPFGALSGETGFDAQLADVVPRLSQRFYNLRHDRAASTGLTLNRQDDGRDASPATLALASMMAEQRTSVRAENGLDRFENHFDRLFPEASASLYGAVKTTLKDGGSSAPRTQWSGYYSNPVPPADMLQLPWRQGYWWIPNGAHANTGSGYPLSSIDVSYDWPRWGAPTYSVAAANSGYVRVFSSCQVRITNPNGWATNYYHLEGIQVRDGQWVNRNTKIADYANDKGSALCQGGSSTGPHLHFSLIHNGYYTSLQGVNLGPYKIDVGRWSYDDNCYNFWLYNEYRGRYICAWNSIYNYGAKQ